MVGRAKESACPTIIFMSPKETPRRTVRESIKASGILKDYPGFITMDCDRPPGFVSVLKTGDELKRSAFRDSAPSKNRVEFTSMGGYRSQMHELDFQLPAEVQYDDSIYTSQSHHGATLGQGFSEAYSEGNLSSSETFGTTPEGASSSRKSSYRNSAFTRNYEYFGFRNVEGARIKVEFQNAEGQPNIKMATVGGFVHCLGRYFLMTVGHVFPGSSEEDFPDSEKSCEFEYDLDNFSEEEVELNEEEVEETSRGSVSAQSTGTASEDDRSSTASQSPPQSIEMVEPQDFMDSTTTQSSKGSTCIASLENACTIITEASFETETIDEAATPGANPIPYPDVFKATIELRDRTNVVLEVSSRSIFSFDGQRSVLDYALLEISGSTLNAVNLGHLEDVEIKTPWMRPARAMHELVLQNNMIVTIVLPGRDPALGTVLSAPTFIPMKSSSAYEEIWTVKLDQSLARGDSGSWVREPATGIMLGHVVAGSPETGFVYIVPIAEILADLKTRFGGEWDVLDWLHETMQSDFSIIEHVKEGKLLAKEEFGQMMKYTEQESFQPCDGLLAPGQKTEEMIRKDERKLEVVHNLWKEKRLRRKLGFRKT